MKNKVKFTVNKNGSISVNVSKSLFKEEFDKIKVLYDLDDSHIDLFKCDGMMFVLICAVQGWISGFDCEAKNDYDIVLDYTRVVGNEFGDPYSVYHVKDGKCIYDEGEDNEETIAHESDEEIMGEDRANID